MNPARIAAALLAATIFGISVPCLHGAEWLAGTARVEITPPVGYAMAGYGARKKVSTGVHDPLYATALVLKTGEQALAFVTCDLAAAVSPRLEAEAEKRFGITHLLLSSSHTHSGPLPPFAAASPPEMQKWWAEVEDKMIEALGRAVHELFPARLAAGRGSVYIGHNRRRLLPDGRVEMFWRNADKLPTHPLDPTVTVLRVDDSSGKPRAILVNYSCHPTVLGPDNLLISADYVGALRSYVEKQTPGATCLFIQGATGDINPYFDKQPPDQQPFEAVRWTGETLGEAVVRTVQRIKTPPADARLQYRVEVHQLSHRWEPGKKVTVALGMGLLDGKIGFASFSADPFVQHQIRLRDQSYCDTTFLFAHTSTRGLPYAGYLPTIRAAVEGGYGAGYNTAVEVGAGERLIDRAVIGLLEMMGKLKAVPE